MSLPTHARLIHLLEQRRFADAEAQLRRILARTPGDAPAHALRALCLADMGMPEAAVRSAEHAVELAPDLAFGHWALGTVLGGEERFLEAGAAAREAIRLEPGDATHHALLAQCLAGQRRWEEAIAAAEDGLRLDARSDSCTRIRALSLQQHGRAEEAERLFAHQVALDPWDALSHAGRGWSALQRGAGGNEAAEHFRASLRLDPASGYARAGLAEALRSRSLSYRFFRRHARRARRVAPILRIAALASGAAVVGALHAGLALHPLLWAAATAPMAAFILFILLSWAAEPLADWSVRRDRMGRALLTPERDVAAGAVVVTLVAGTASAALAAATGSEAALRGALGILPLVIPVAGTFRCAAGWPRRVMAGYTLLLLLASGAGVVTSGAPGLALASIAAVGAALAGWLVRALGRATLADDAASNSA
jgi:tetratricopeptide (TPR) repeat protein